MIRPSSSDAPHLFLSCGEASGDRYGAALLAALRRERPELRVMDARLDAVDREARAAGGSLLPSLEAQAGWHYGRPGVDALTNEWMDYGTVALNLRWILFDFGGTALVGTRNVAPYLDRLGTLLEAYYSIGYVRPGEPDGSLHSLKVEVTRPGVTVRAPQKVRNSPRDERLADVALSRP